ncbi:hypothetical protein SCHPADRAFT_914154 [Schizopora paradoxa]|uniref:Uncharacterized protein n=1 Tax=Schizopora paradoxa TaxID=27342 RepID=A0A0H2RW65_9AGAM|nr:hypothetical protein SCHPADRAFT_914154 [Schizopora paradoxa]
MHPFAKQVIESSRSDGYWVEAFPFSSKDDQDAPDIIGYGLGTKDTASKIKLFRNPHNTLDHADGKELQTEKPLTSWKHEVIAELMFPVAMSCADISSDGFNDLIISDHYGPSMNDIWSEGGRVLWFKNPGVRQNGKWEQHYIGKSAGMHRLKTGHFTRTDRIQVMAIPIVVKSADFTSPTEVLIYTSPLRPISATGEDEGRRGKGWDCEVAFSCFRLVNEVIVIPGANNGLDQVRIAGRGGVHLLWYEAHRKKWASENIGKGLPKVKGNPYWGAGSVDVARVHADASGYIACAEAFHGNTVSVYVKSKGAPKDKIGGSWWTRHFLEDFGPLNDAHTGSVHHVCCADIDGDGVEETLVACIGADPPDWKRTGVWCYKPIDLGSGLFSKFKLSDDSAGRIAVADFRKGGRLDFATISYSVPGHFESPNPSINLYAGTPITAEKLNEEVLFKILDPSSTFLVDEVPFLEIANRRLSMVVVPKQRRFDVRSGDAVKVIAGKVFWKDKSGSLQERTKATQPFTQISTVVESEMGYISADVEGAAFVLMRKNACANQPPYSGMDQLKTWNIFPTHFSEEVKRMEFPWVKVQDRSWAHGGFKDLEFYNLVGFHVQLATDALTSVVHIQMWTAGLGVNAGFHNHADKSFCEIHACLVNGTGRAGMHWATVEDDADFDPTKPEKGKYEGIVVPDLCEHGPLWRTDADGLPLLRKNDTVDYPWHAWIAGDADENDNGGQPEQSFDVWIAFEFPPFIADVKVAAMSRKLPPGRYQILDDKTSIAISVRDSSSKDGSPIILDGDVEFKNTLWDVALISRTSFYTFQNLSSGSFAMCSYPPEKGQPIVGSRSPAALDLTSAWAVHSVQPNTYSVRLIGSNLHMSSENGKSSGENENVQVTVQDPSIVKWVFKPVSK